MRICFIQSTFHPFVGGTERQSLQLAQRLKKQGIEVEVVTARFHGLKPFEVIEDVPVRRVWIYDSGSKRNSFQTLSWLVSAFLYLLFSKPFDVYHAHQALTPAFIASMISRLKGKKSLSKIANTGKSGELYALNASIFGKILKPFVLAVDGFIATSKQAKQELVENSISNIFEIPNGVDTEKFKPVKNKAGLRKKLHLPLNKKLLLYLAKSEEQKALPWLSFLLEAWKGIPVKDAQLIILGKKELLAKLPQVLRSIPSFAILGIQSNPQDFMAASDAFVLPSSAEGLSNVLLEAMASGLPIAATKVSGTEDLIQDGKNGLLIPSNNASVLRKALVHVLSHPDPRWGKNARQTIIKKYGFAQVVSAYVSLYKRLQKE